MRERIIKGFVKVFSASTPEAYFRAFIGLLLVFVVGLAVVIVMFLCWEFSYLELRALVITLIPLPTYLYIIGASDGITRTQTRETR